MWIGYYGYYSFPNQSVIHHFQTFHIFQAFNDLGPEAMHKLKKKIKMKKTKSYFTLFFVTNTCDHEKYFNAKKTERIFSSFFF